MNLIFKTLTRKSVSNGSLRRSFKQLVRLGDTHSLKYNGKFCSLTLYRVGKKVEIQTFDYNGLQESNHSQPFLVEMNELT